MWTWGWWTASAAEPLYVEPGRTAETEAAVEALWPGDHLTVLARPESVEHGFVWDGARLMRVWEGRVTWGDAPDAPTAVVLARAWSREPPPLPPAPLEDLEPAQPPPTAPALAPPRASAAWQPIGTLGAEVGLGGGGAVRAGVGAGGRRFDARLVARFVADRSVDEFGGGLDGLVTVPALGAVGGWRVGPLLTLGAGVGRSVPADVVLAEAVGALGAEASAPRGLGARLTWTARVGLAGVSSAVAFEAVLRRPAGGSESAFALAPSFEASASEGPAPIAMGLERRTTRSKPDPSLGPRVKGFGGSAPGGEEEPP